MWRTRPDLQCALGDNLACISVYPKPCSCTFEQLHLGTFAKFCFSVLITDLECSRRDEQNDTTLSFSNKVLPSAVYRNTANTAEIPRAVRGTSKTYRGTTLTESGNAGALDAQNGSSSAPRFHTLFHSVHTLLLSGCSGTSCS